MKRKRLLAAVMAAVMASTLTMSMPMPGYAMDQGTETVASEPEESDSSDVAVTNPEQDVESVAEESASTGESAGVGESQETKPDAASVEESTEAQNNTVGAAEDTGAASAGTVGAAETIEAVSNDFYTYTPDGDGYRVGFTDEFYNALTPFYKRSLTGYDAEGNNITWNTGDPLPNPCPDGKYNDTPVVSMNGMFTHCFFSSLDLSRFDTSNVINMSHMFDSCNLPPSFDLSGFNTSHVTDMDHMFANCGSLTKLDLSSFDTSNVTDMSGMFSFCSNLKSLDLSKFDTSNVTDMSSMFECCRSLTNLDLSSFDTSNVTDMSAMFSYCESLTNLDLSSFDTSNVTDMSLMFEYCNSLTNLDLSSFDTSNVTDMSSMFDNCHSLTNLDLSSFDTSNVTDMYEMFYNCNSLTVLDLSSFDISQVKEMRGIFNEIGDKTKCYAKDQATADKLNNQVEDHYSAHFHFIYDPNHVSNDTNIDFKGLITFPDSTVAIDGDYSVSTVKSNVFLTFGLTKGKLNSFLKSLTWKSSDENIAKVIGVKMSGSANDLYAEISLAALNPGNVVITGENSNGFKTTVNVTVEPKVVINKVPEFLGGSNNVTYSVSLPSGNKEYLEQFINGIELNSNENIQVTCEKVSYAEDNKSVVVTLRETALRKGNGSIKLTTSGKKDYISNDFTFVPEYYSYLQYTGNSSNDTYGITYSEKKYNPDKLPFEFVLEFHPGKLDQETTAKVKNIDVSVSGIPFKVISDNVPDIELKANEKYTYKFSVNKTNMAGAPSEVDSTAVITAKSGDKFGTVTREISVHNYDLESQIAKEVEKNNQKKMDEAKKIKSSIAKREKKALKNTAKEYLQNIDNKYTLNQEYNDIFSDTELTIIKFVIAQQVATYNISEKKAQDAVKSSLEYKLDKQVLSYLEKYTGSLSTYNTAEGKNIPIAFYMNTEKCGKVKCEFEYNSTAFSFNGHQYGETGTINGKITILKNDNVKKIYGSIVNATDCDEFSQGVSEIAASSLSNCVKQWNKYFKSGDEVLGDGSKIFSVMSYGLFVVPFSVEMAELSNELDRKSAKIFKKAGVELLIDEAKSIVGLCPVDIYIYDSENNLVGSIENNKVSKVSDEGVYLETIGNDNDGKMATLFNKDYSFVYKATDNGKLNVKIYEMANWADVLRVSEIHDIPLEKNKEYKQEINNQSLTDLKSYSIKSSDETVYQVDNVVDLMDDSTNDDIIIPDVVEVSKVQLNHDNAELLAGDSMRIIATVEPGNATDKTLVWSSSNEKIATVDENGNVSALTPGKATITAKSGDITATCVITVNEKKSETLPASSVKLNKTSLSLDKDGSEVLSIIELLPKGASTEGLQWISDNNKVVTVDDNGKVNAIGNGSAVISLLNSDGKVLARCTANVTGYNNIEDGKSQETRSMYRLYNPNSGEHFYTSNQGERDHLVSFGWRYEGVAWNAPLTGAPIFRLYNPNAGDHHYTGSEKERDDLVKLGWKYEGVAWYTAPSTTKKPQYRLYNPNCTGAGAHHYTGSIEERDGLVKLGWRYEGIAWYGV